MKATLRLTKAYILSNQLEKATKMLEKHSENV